MISDNDWLVLQQYEGGMEPLNNYSLFSQSAKVVVHYKLFGARRCLELLSSRFFTMCDNISRYTETRRTKDLTHAPETL